MDAGADAAVLPAMNVANLVGFGAVVVAMPAFAMVRDALFGFGGGALVLQALATNVLAALTASALGAAYLERAASIGFDPAVLHRVAVIGSGTLDQFAA